MEKTPCPACGKDVVMKENGRAHHHKHPTIPQRSCVGIPESNMPEPQQCSEPKCTCGGDGGPEHELAIAGAFDDPALPGPWHGALDVGVCGSCGDRITEGDRIREDGTGGYECGACGDSPATVVPAQAEVDHWQAQAREAVKRHEEQYPPNPGAVVELRIPAAPGPMPAAPDDAQAFMEFEDPTTPAERPRKVNVSGQPEPNRDWQGRYIVKDPELGDFRWQKNGQPKGLTRVTTFVKRASDNKAINDWRVRNVLMGASLRPDVLRRAHGLTHEGGKDQLNRIAGELETAAGAKVSSEEGTFLHEETEYIDAGLRTWQESPPAYQQDLKRYVEALDAYGLEPVPGLIERTVMVREFGGVVGMFDRIFYHRASGQYVIGDLKTGKTLKYGMDEIQAQLWFYAHGVNQNGLYDWNTDTWTRDDPSRGGLLATVREDVAVIVHMPVQGPEAGAVYVRKADLVRGKAYAELCANVRDWPKSKVQPWTGVPVDVTVADDGIVDAVIVEDQLALPSASQTWPEKFAAVRDREHATQLWREAKAAGLEGIVLNTLIQIARDALIGKG